MSEVPEHLRQKLFTEPGLISPAAAQKALGKEVFPLIEKLIDSPDKRPIIAAESSNRKEWTGRPPEDMFDIIEGEEA